ncbi:unnamed protein product [Blepharisma stoltei]|uniref:Uncharacterized protein n=1 Tax=Blepharisma stoltei TaxID=1481888 RepID=A0AAU9KRL1_9CILI|nr:unnamed protein product [Blepharisma stoltei]
MDEESVKNKESSSSKLDTVICQRNDLYKRLEAERESHYKTVLFETFIKLENSDNKTKASKEYLILNYTALFIRKFQLLSIVLMSFETSANITLESSLNGLLKLVRIDILCIDFNAESEFLFILLASIWGLFISFSLIYFQIYNKKSIMLKPFIFVAKLLGWAIDNIFFIPYLYSVGIYTKYTFFSKSMEVKEYDNTSSSSYSTYWAIPLILGIPIILLASFFRTIYYCNPFYTVKIKRNRMHSSVALKDIYFQVILVFLSFYDTDLFFNILCVMISLFMIFQYFIYMPFVAIFDNVFDISTWTMILFGVISHQLSIHTSAKSVRALIMIFIYPCSWIIIYYFMSWCFDHAINASNKDPYGIELKIRNILFKSDFKFYGNSDIQIKAIFKEATKKFLSFKMLFVWEGLFYLRYERNKSLGLLKLSKINFSCQKHLRLWHKIHRNITKFYSYPNIEAEYLYYYYYNKLINEEYEEDLILIRYIRDINQLNAKDLEVACDLWELYTKLSNVSDYSPSSISKSCSILAETKRKYEEKAEKMMRRHHSDPIVLEIYGSYKADFLENIHGKMLLQRSRSLKSTKNTGVDRSPGLKHQGNAVMVVSGMFGSIGDILYLNDEILRLLSIDSIDEYLGTSFTQFIPAPFDVMHNDILRRGLIFGERVEVHRPNLFLITTRGHCVEVTMHFRLSFFKQVPYFIADFNEKGHNSNLILHSPEGYIYAASQNINQLIGDRKGTIFEVLNNIAYYFEKYEPGTSFEYHEDFSCFMLRTKLEIDGSPLEALYLANDADYFTSINAHESSPAKENDELFSKDIDKTEITAVPVELNLKSGVVSSYTSTMFSKMHKNKKIEEVESDSKKIIKFCKSMSMKIRVSIIFLLGIIISTLLAEKYLIKELSLSIFINNFATMRFLGVGILFDSRSLDLLSKDYNLSYTETAYRNSLQSNIINLENALNSVSSDISSYSYLTNVFIENEIVVTEQISNGIFRVNKVNLFQALQKIVQEGSKIYNTELSKFSDVYDSFYYIYWNFPAETFRCLNESLYSTINEMQGNTLSVLDFLKNFKLLVFIPALLIIALSIPDIANLEKYNKKNWSRLSSLNIERQIALRDKLIERLCEFHGIIVEEIEPKYTSKKFYSFIWKSFIFKILLLELASILYYFISIYVLQSQISDALISQTDYRFHSGLRRSLTKTTYFWAREQFLDKNNASFITNILHDGSFFPSIPHKLQNLIDDYDYCQELINYGSLKKYYNDEMVSLMVGNPCTQLNNTISKCKTSYISMGIVPSIKLYINEIKRVQSYNRNDWKEIIKLEQYSKLICSSVGSMVNIFMNTTDSHIDDNLNNLIITTLFYFLLMLIIAALIVFTAVNRMKNDLIDKIEILKYFE